MTKTNFRKTPLARAALCAGLLLAAWTAAPAAGPADGVVLRNEDVTESALVQALSIDAPLAASSATRGFKPVLRNDAAAAAVQPPKAAGRASVLITFDTSSAKLTPESMAALDTVARAFKSDVLAKLTFSVEGHADLRGDAVLNRNLSKARADAVVAYLVARHGIRAERLRAEGRGAEEPLNRERVDAPENRRVTFVSLR